LVYLVKLNVKEYITMSRSRFSEGFILGAIVGAVATYFLSDVCVTGDQSNDSEEKNSSEEDKESKVASTLDSVEKGLENLSKMVEDKKKTKS
jgi:hypothetical protein